MRKTPCSPTQVHMCVYVYSTSWEGLPLRVVLSKQRNIKVSTNTREMYRHESFDGRFVVEVDQDGSVSSVIFRSPMDETIPFRSLDSFWIGFGSVIFTRVNDGFDWDLGIEGLDLLSDLRDTEEFTSIRVRGGVWIIWSQRSSSKILRHIKIVRGVYEDYKPTQTFGDYP